MRITMDMRHVLWSPATIHALWPNSIIIYSRKKHSHFGKIVNAIRCMCWNVILCHCCIGISCWMDTGMGQNQCERYSHYLNAANSFDGRFLPLTYSADFWIKTGSWNWSFSSLNFLFYLLLGFWFTFKKNLFNCKKAMLHVTVVNFVQRNK